MPQSEYFNQNAPDEQERLERIEKLDKKLSDKLTSIDSFSSRISSLESTCQGQNKTLKYLESSVPALSKALSDILPKAHEPEPKQDLSPVTSQLAQHDSLLQKINATLNDLSAQIGQIKNSVGMTALKSDFKIVKDQLDHHVEHFKSTQECTHDELISHEQNIADQFDKLEGLNQRFIDIKSKTDNASSKVSEIASTIDAIKTGLNKELLDKIQNIATLVDLKIENAKPNFDLDTIVDSVKDKLRKEIDNITIDSSNASLKYNNMASDVALMAKKIENVYLLIKKLETAKAP